MRAFIRIAFALSCLYGAVSLDIARARATQHEITYALIETRNDHDYVIDYDLSDDDCAAIVNENQRCEAQ